MRLLSDDELLASETVANACMNRDRGLSGVNSYTRDLGFDLGAFLKARVTENGSAVWYDACCGTGRALAEFAVSPEPWIEQVQIIGVDLIGDFVEAPTPRIRFLAADVVRFRPDEPVDLITCVHGLHYLGDKLAFLETAYASLRMDGVFLGHFDPANLCFEGDAITWTTLLRRVRAAGVYIELRKNRLRIVKTDAPLTFGLQYRGATRAEQPNFSGMVGVDSWYAAE